jgi:Na+/H+ antiporter NhaC
MQQQAPQIEMPSLWVALIPIVLTIGLLGLQIFYYDDFTPHIALAVGFAITGLVGWSQGWRWKGIESLGLTVVSGDFSNLLYAPLAFACWLSPAIGILYAQTGWFSKRAEEDEVADEAPAVDLDSTARGVV